MLTDDDAAHTSASVESSDSARLHNASAASNSARAISGFFNCTQAFATNWRASDGGAEPSEF